MKDALYLALCAVSPAIWSIVVVQIFRRWPRPARPTDPGDYSI